MNGLHGRSRRYEVGQLWMHSGRWKAVVLETARCHWAQGARFCHLGLLPTPWSVILCDEGDLLLERALSNDGIRS